MDPFIKQFLGEGPYPCPLEKINEVMDVYASDRIFIMLNKKELNMPDGVHSHRNYEFVIPFSHHILSRVGKRKSVIEKNKLFPLNHEQDHGPVGQVTVNNLLGLQIDRDFIQEISRSVYRKSEVFFKNDGITMGSEMQNLIRLFMLESRQRQAGYEFILGSLSTQIVVNMLRQVKSNLPVLITERNFSEKENINRSVEFLRELYDKDYSLEEVARVANLSPYHFIRVFKAQTGKTPYEYLLDVKIEKALEMLRIKNCTVTDVCFACGFNNLSHFTTLFKRKMGILPSDYRKSFIAD